MREQQRRRRPLQNTRGDQQAERSRQPAQQGAQRESQHAEAEQAPTPEAIAQTPTGDQQHPKRQLVTGDDQTDPGEIGGELPLDHRRCHVDHEQIEHRDETAQQQHRQAGQPSPLTR